MKRIGFYRTDSGRSPVEDVLVSLPAKARQKIVFVLRIIREIHPIPKEYFKKLRNTEGVWEVRIQFAGNIYRLLGFFEDDNIIILVSGFTKKSQKTPKREIALAVQRKREYLKHKGL